MFLDIVDAMRMKRITYSVRLFWFCIFGHTYYRFMLRNNSPTLDWLRTLVVLICSWAYASNCLDLNMILDPIDPSYLPKPPHSHLLIHVSPVRSLRLYTWAGVLKNNSFTSYRLGTFILLMYSCAHSFNCPLGSELAKNLSLMVASIPELQ